MQKYFIKTFLLIIGFVFVCSPVMASSYSKAENLLRKAQNASIKEEGYEYANAAREIYKKKYDENQADIKALVGLSKTYQMTGDRQEAKLYILKAYNIKPYDANLQKEMGNFYYSFQEYSTAIEYYNLALASGLLKDFDTNMLVAKCYEKLGDLDNAEIYYKVSAYINPKSRKAANKINSYESEKKGDNSAELDKLRYKYLFKSKKPSASQQEQEEAENIIEQINSLY